jgi:hypothetical protein
MRNDSRSRWVVRRFFLLNENLCVFTFLDLLFNCNFGKIHFPNLVGKKGQGLSLKRTKSLKNYRGKTEMTDVSEM